MDINQFYPDLEQVRKEFKSGQTASDYCRSCKGLLRLEEDEATICKDCVINMMKRR